MKKQYSFLALLILITSTLSFATVSLEISGDMVVETVENSGAYPVYVELSGDLTENGNSYLLGKVTSGTRAAFTGFAGLNWGGSMAGDATRFTQTANFSDDLTDGPSAVFKRKWELNNIGSAVSGTGSAGRPPGRRSGRSCR